MAKARKVEIVYAEKKPVWVNIPRHEAKPKVWKISKSRWIDVNKGDDTNTVYRSRMVGKEFNDKVIEGLFAATPPLEALRYRGCCSAGQHQLKGEVLVRSPVPDPKR